MRFITYLFLLIIIILGVSFAILNAEQVSFHYYVGVTKISLSLLLVLTFAVGAIIAMLFLSWPLMRLKADNYRLRQRIKQAEQEVDNLRAIPIKDNH